MKTRLLVLFFILFSSIVLAQKPVPIIFDTDMGPDYDDVGALAMLHAFADSGKAEILATIASNRYPQIAGVLDAFNTYFGRPETPIGIPKRTGVAIGASQGWPQKIIEKYPHDLRYNEDAPDAVTIYRKILSKQKDKSVTIVTVGFLTNLANLLESKPDFFSKLSGKELIKKKVKLLVCMAGKFPEGTEFNVEKDPQSSIITFEGWPTSIIFSGFEIGAEIKTGLPIVNNDAIKNNPVKDVFSLCISNSAEDVNGRKSWDQTAVLVAVEGWKKYFDVRQGKFLCMKDGSNRWDSTKKNHYYLIKKIQTLEITNIINNLMMHQPKK